MTAHDPHPEPTVHELLDFEATHEFFICPTGAEKFDFARATQSDFQCPEHGAILQQHDNGAELEALRERVAALERETRSAG